MKTYFPILMTNLICSVLYSAHVLADLTDQYLTGLPTHNKSLVTGQSYQLPIYIQADKVQANYHKSAVFSGNVHVKQGNSILTADYVQLYQEQEKQGEPIRIITASDNVKYDSNEIILKGLKAWSNLNTKDTNVYYGNYIMVGRQGHGDADTIKLRGNSRYSILENGSFTSCLPGENSWSIFGAKVNYDRQEQIIKIWNAQFKIGKVPVFYSPYVQLPIGNKRRSGLLIPNTKYSSSNGFIFGLAYYLNLAPNYDLTITQNYIGNYGTQIQTEFRYLTSFGIGLIEFDWLPNSHPYNYNHSSYSDYSLLYWKHSGIIDQVWRFNVDYTKASDTYYFNDFVYKYDHINDGYVTQKFSIGYTNKNWDLVLSGKQFQTFNPNINTYFVLPQLDINYYKNNIGLFNFKVAIQAAKFTNVKDHYLEATRLHIEPTISLPLTTFLGSLNIEAKLMATHYLQENIQNHNNNTATNQRLEKAVNRVIPQFKADSTMVLDRNIEFSQGYTQTLEPRLQYLHVPYRNQNHIGIYDSTILQIEYTDLFHNRTYSGLDRITPTNQLIGGITTRIYDNMLVERFYASIGQIYHFSQHDHDIRNTISTLGNYNDASNIIWAGDSYYRANNHWGMHGGMQYHMRFHSIVLGDAVLEYSRDKNHIVQLNYRYVSSRPQHIKQIPHKIFHDYYQQNISQVGVIASWPLVSHWLLMGAYYYNIKSSHSVDQLVGLQYHNCCWAMHFSYERKITGWNVLSQSSNYDNKLSFNIELRGLSSNYGLGSEKTLSSSTLPYQQLL